MSFDQTNLKTITINDMKFLCIAYQFNAELQTGDSIEFGGGIDADGISFSNLVTALRTFSSAYNKGTFTKDLNDNYSITFTNDSLTNSYNIDINYNGVSIYTMNASGSPTSTYPARADFVVFIENLYDHKILPYSRISFYGVYNEDSGGNERLLTDFSVISGSKVIGSAWWANIGWSGSPSVLGQDLIDFYNNVTPSSEDDPYAEAGNSSASNNPGTFGNTGTDVGLTSLPSMDPSASGFMNAFNPSGGELNTFAQYLWNTLDLSSLKLLYSNPMEAIIGLLAVPIQPTTGGPQTINLGNIATSCSADIITNRFAELTCGTVTIPEWWGAYLDYDPYTQVSIYLPYIGVQTLDANDIIGKAVSCKYHVDVLSGACIAMLECAGKVLYHFAGQCGIQIPVTASSFGGIMQSILSMGVSAVQSIASNASGNFSSAGEVASSVFNAARNKVQRSGSVGSAAGIMDNQTPYFIVQRPVQCKPADQNQFTGYPAYITYFLKDLTGYTEVEEIRLHDIPATADEITELEAVLKSGVIL